MKCDECLTALESGNPWQRRAARRHTANCPACAEAVASLTAFERELATIEPLPPAQRQRWLSIAASEPAKRRFAAPAYLTVGGVAAAAVLAALAFWLARDRGATNDGQPGDPTQLVATSEPTPLTSRGDPALRGQLMELSAELDRLSHEASLLDERRQVRELTDQTP